MWLKSTQLFSGFRRSPWISRWAHWLACEGWCQVEFHLFPLLTCFEAFYTAFQSAVDSSVSLLICHPVTALCPSGSSVCYLTGKVRQVESLLSVFAAVAVGFLSDHRLAFTVKLSCASGLGLSEKQSGRCWAACLTHSGSSAWSWLWQMLSAALDKTSPFLEFHISVNENIGGFVLLWILEG